MFQNNYVTDVLKLISSTDHKVGACNTSTKTFVTSDAIITKSNKLKHALFGAGMGFWIERDLFLNLGGFDEALTIDEEDADFSDPSSTTITSHPFPPLFSADVCYRAVKQLRSIAGWNDYR